MMFVAESRCDKKTFYIHAVITDLSQIYKLVVCNVKSKFEIKNKNSDI